MSDNAIANNNGSPVTFATKEVGGVHTPVMTLDAEALAALESVTIGGVVALDAPTLAALESINATTGGLTDAQLRAANVPVTDSAIATLLTTLIGSIKAHNEPFVDGSIGQVILGKRRDSDSTLVADGDLNTFNMDEEGRLKVSTKPASYATVTGDISAVAGTVSIDCQRFSGVALQVHGTFSTMNCTFEVSNNSTDGVNGNWGVIQAARSNANTAETTTGNLSASPAYLWEVSVNPYKWFRVRCTARTSGTQTWTLVPGSYATEVTPVVQSHAITGTVTATVTPPAPATPYFLNSAATTNGALILTGTSSVHSLWATNEGASVAYLKLYNKATAPTVGTDIPEMIIPIPAAVSGVPGVVNPNMGFIPFRFALGLGIAITRNAIHTDTTAIGAGEVKVKLSRAV